MGRWKFLVGQACLEVPDNSCLEVPGNALDSDQSQFCWSHTCSPDLKAEILFDDVHNQNQPESNSCVNVLKFSLSCFHFDLTQFFHQGMMLHPPSNIKVTARWHYLQQCVAKLCQSLPSYIQEAIDFPKEIETCFGR